MALYSFNKKTIANMLVTKRWLWHVAYWAAYYLSQAWSYYITVKYYDKRFLHFMLINELFFIIMTYFTIYIYKYFIKKKQYYLYFIVGFATWIFYLVCKINFQIFYLKSLPDFENVKWHILFWANIAIFIAYFVFITMCKFFKENYITQYFENEKKQQQLNAELDNLKAQIAPHFLFNTMNNFYGLAVDKSPKLPALMLKLSDLLRHSLYETKKPFVLLTDEIDAIKNYIELEKIRLEDNVELKFISAIDGDTYHFEIAPLLLIVFIENAFKHSKMVRDKPINISINLQTKNDWLHFSVKNNFNDLCALNDIEIANGIGLQNVKRRLNLLYEPEFHSLETKIINNFYEVELKVKLSRKINK